MGSRKLPSGTVTLLFTDIEGSTRMLQELGREAYVRALTEHRRLLREAFSSHGGVEVEMQGDSFHFAFPYARDAVAAAVDGQRALNEHDWEIEPIRVRMGLHTGEPMQADGLYAGLDVHRAARIMSAAHGGQVIVSARTAELVEGELVGIELQDLGEHRLKDLTAPQRLYQAGKGDFPPLKTLVRPTNLPVQPNRLIGRELELREIADRLRAPGTRLLTLTGPGGTGKTRVALHAAAYLVDDFLDGVTFVALAPVREAASVLSAIAQALSLREQPGVPLPELLAEFLSEKRMLLVLDNFEHVVEAASEVAALIGAASGTRALVTSRVALRVAAEELYVVPTLSVPAEHVENAERLLEHDAVALFVERAQASSPGFALTTENGPVIAAICARLDGLPLAIELAAARMRLLSAEAILSRLEHSLELLTKGRRDADERQQTLRSTIDWSYGLLDPAEQALFARLSVFLGGFTISAAEAVCALDSESDVFDGIASLLEKSLVFREEDAGHEPRFSMLETIREYATEQLAARGECERFRRRHAEWLLDVVADTQHAEGDSALEQLAAEHDNFRAALRWALEAQSAETALRLTGGLFNLWDLHGHLREGRDWLTRALALPPAEDQAARLTHARLVATGVEAARQSPARCRAARSDRAGTRQPGYP